MKNYHIVRISPVVNLTLRQQIVADPKISKLTYDELLSYILNGHYNYSGSFSCEMQKLGNRCEEIVFDVEPLQKKWAEENQLLLEDNERWQFKIVLAQLKQLDPDVVYLQGFTRITAVDIEKFRSELPNLKKIAVHSGFPGGFDCITEDTIVFCGVPSIQRSFKELGVDAHLLYHSFDPRVLDLLQQDRPKVPFSFLGSSGYGYGAGHKTRYWELLKLAYNTQLHLWLDDKDQYQNPTPNHNPFVDRPLREKFYFNLTDDVGSYPDPVTPLRYLLPFERVSPPRYGLDFFQIMHDSEVTFHRHTNAVTKEVGAMRLYQATGVGSCLLTDTGANMQDLFEPDQEIVTYCSLEECIEKANYLFNHPEVAREIAQKGQNKTLKYHSSANRVELVHHCLQKALAAC